MSLKDRIWVPEVRGMDAKRCHWDGELEMLHGRGLSGRNDRGLLDHVREAYDRQSSLHELGHVPPGMFLLALTV